MKTTKQVNQELQENFPFLEIISEYTGANNKVLIRCNKCGHEWWAIARSVRVSKHGCPNCAKEGAKNTIHNSAEIRFLEQMSKRQDVIVRGEYKDSKTKIELECTTCGHIWETYPSNATRYGCPKCATKKTHDAQKLTQEEFVSRAKQIHGDLYDYSKVEYINWTTPVIILCKDHGEFAQIPGKHLSGQGCPKCKGKNWTKEDFIKEANRVHNNKYDYSEIPEDFQKSTSKLPIICPIHGKFEQDAYVHINMKCGCPRCSDSHGETEVASILNDMKIKYKREFNISNPYGDRNFRVDFIFKYNNIIHIIEFNGEQHYRPIHLWGGQNAFEKQQKRDSDLRKFCETKKVKLLEIRFDDINIKSTIQNFLNTAVLEKEFSEQLETNIGEGCDANLEISSETKESEPS